MIYLDTSVLVKLHLPEADTPAVLKAIGAETRLLVSDLARVEFHSALWRRHREKAATRTRVRSVLARFQKKWPRYDRVAVSPEVLEQSTGLLARHPLRTLDALQLASALLVAKRAPELLRFGCADRRLRTAAEAEGLSPLL